MDNDEMQELIDEAVKHWQEKQEGREQKQTADLGELLAAEQQTADNLKVLFRNPIKNAVGIGNATKRLKELDTEIGRAQAEQQALIVSRRAPKIAELEAQQAEINNKIAAMSRQPSKYAAKLAELGKQSRAIDEQIEEVQSG